MTGWTTDEENTFLCTELLAFKTIREKDQHCYGKIKQFINALYTCFIAKFPLKDGETPESKRKVIVSFQ
jgi:hypothetical protein